MAVLQKVKINNEWVPVSGSNVNSGGGGGGITEEKEVYIGTEPTEEAKLWIDTDDEDEPSSPSGGNGGSSSGGGAESPYAMKVFIVPEGVMTATEDAPYTFSAEEAEEFLAQGDFKRTIVKYPTQVLIGMGALNIANLCLYIESDSAQGFMCEGTEVTKVSGETDSTIEYIKTIITCANTQNAIMGYCSIIKYYATTK